MGYKIKRVLTWVNNEEKQIYPATWKPLNPDCWYKFDGDYTDSTGTYGVAEGTSTFQTLSSGIKVLQTDGSNKVFLPADVASSAITTYTISFWMKVITTSPAYGYYAGSGGDNAARLCFYESTSGRNFVEWNNTNSSLANTRDITPSGINSGWRLVTLRSNGTSRSNVSLTINATNTVSTGGTDGTDSSSIFGWNNSRFTIGARFASASGSGQVTSVQMSNFVISKSYWDDNTVSDMYNQTKANYGL